MTAAAHDTWYLTGPTASGKTQVGLELAERLGAEIVSMDSMALFRGMDIGTAKPTLQERCLVPHHLVDLIDAHQDFSLAQYLDAADRATADIRQRGRQVLFAGGTPLYLKGLLRGVFDGPPADWAVRNQLLEEANHQGPEYLHVELVKIDPVSAARLHPNDTRRLVRALEVYRKTGIPISELQRQFSIGRPADECRVFVLDWDRDVLCDRIDRRVDQMFAQGLVEEVRRLLNRPSPLSRTAGQAVGYREVIEHLAGKHDLPATVQLVKLHTRQLAKRQMTWFRSLTECRFVKVAEPFDAAGVARAIGESGGERWPLQPPNPSP